MSETPFTNPNDGHEDINQEPQAVADPGNEYPEFDKEEAQRLRDEYGKHLFGARILSSANFEDSHHDIVQNSFNRARNRGDKIEGERPDIRRNYAYLDRLEKLVEKHGDNAIQKLCRLSATKLIVKPEDISDKYWARENMRSIERGESGLTAEMKEEKTENIRERQRRSVEKWSNYLGDEASPFPLWFKAYAFDGISKMGRYDGDREVFLKRRKGDIASYPNLNEAALSQTYQAIVAENGNDPDVEQLVDNGNFNKLYSKFYTEQNYKFENVKIPERAEDVHGKWVEYGIDQMGELFAASALNGCWCIGQDYGVLEGYFDAGQYNHPGERIDIQENLASDLNNKSKFILFHPTSAEGDENLGIPVVSIRLDRNGEVAEISGVMEDNSGMQLLNDSLVPEVKKKVLSLPGGEKYRKAFDQREELMSIRNKLVNGEDLAGDDLAFLWNPDKVYYSIGEYEELSESSEFIDAKDKSKEMFAGQGERDVKDLARILENYGLLRSAKLIPQIAANGTDLDALAAWTMTPQSGWQSGRKPEFDMSQIAFAEALLKNGLSVEKLFDRMTFVPFAKEHPFIPQGSCESGLLSYGIAPGAILESVKNDGEKGKLRIDAYADRDLMGHAKMSFREIIPFVDLTDHNRWEYEIPDLDLLEDADFRRTLDQAAIKQFKEATEKATIDERGEWDFNNGVHEGINDAFDEFMGHLERERGKYGRFEYSIDDVVEIARDAGDANKLLKCGADPDVIMNKLIEFADEKGEEIDEKYIYSINDLLDAYANRGERPAMPDYIISKFSPKFVEQYADRLGLRGGWFGASANAITEKMNPLAVLNKADDLYSRWADEEILTGKAGEGIAEALYIIDNLTAPEDGGVQTWVLTDSINDRLRKDNVNAETKERLKSLLQNIIDSID